MCRWSWWSPGAKATAFSSSQKLSLLPSLLQSCPLEGPSKIKVLVRSRACMWYVHLDWTQAGPSLAARLSAVIWAPSGPDVNKERKPLPQPPSSLPLCQQPSTFFKEKITPLVFPEHPQKCTTMRYFSSKASHPRSHAKLCSIKTNTLSLLPNLITKIYMLKH